MTSTCPRTAVIGRGRLGRALAGALNAQPEAPLTALCGRDDALPASTELALLCVPDAAIAQAAASLPRREGLLVAHCSGATTLAPLDGLEAASLHPLMTVPESGASFAGVTAAVAGSTPRALDAVTCLARVLGMSPVAVDDADRAAYHAAASVASNFLVTLEGFAEDLAGTAGVRREALVPLVRAAVENWAASGAGPALTGPIARGDEHTVARQRAAVAERTPAHLPLFDALTDATRELAAR